VDCVVETVKPMAPSNSCRLRVSHAALIAARPGFQKVHPDTLCADGRRATSKRSCSHTAKDQPRRCGQGCALDYQFRHGAGCTKVSKQYQSQIQRYTLYSRRPKNCARACPGEMCVLAQSGSGGGCSGMCPPGTGPRPMPFPAQVISLCAEACFIRR
jgi:hypothetical protein